MALAPTRLVGWFVAANTHGEDEGARFTGCSTILGAGGEVLARAGATGDEVLVADVELGAEPG